MNDLVNSLIRFDIKLFKIILTSTRLILTELQQFPTVICCRASRGGCAYKWNTYNMMMMFFFIYSNGWCRRIMSRALLRPTSTNVYRDSYYSCGLFWWDRCHRYVWWEESLMGGKADCMQSWQTCDNFFSKSDFFCNFCGAQGKSYYANLLSFMLQLFHLLSFRNLGQFHHDVCQ